MRGTVCKRLRKMVAEEYPSATPLTKRVLYKAAKRAHMRWRTENV